MHRVVLSRQDGLEVAVLTYGATLQSLVPARRDGAGRSVILGLGSIDGYTRTTTITSERPLVDTPTASPMADSSSMVRSSGYLATRSGLIFTEGAIGFDRKVWEIRRSGCEGAPSLSHVATTALDGEEGYPGAVDVEVEFTLVCREHATDPVPSDYWTGGQSSI